MRGNEWYDHAQGQGGYAIGFVQKFYGVGFTDAVTMLLGGEQGELYRQSAPREPEPPKAFVLPKANGDMRRAFAYLMGTRCIDREVLSAFAHERMIYEDVPYHNAVFVGYDADGVVRHAHCRSTFTQGDPFRMNVEGCDARYSFHLIGQSDTVYVFEAPIDLLSFISLYKQDWQQHSYVALCGTSEHALIQLLTDVPKVKRVALCLDNDKAGLKARERLTGILAERGYEEVFSLLPQRKDWNEDLQSVRQIPATETTQRPAMTMLQG